MPRLHVCSLALIGETVAETGARSLVTLLEPRHAGRPPAGDHARAASLSRRVRHRHAHARPGSARPYASGRAPRVRARLGPRRADGDPLLRRRQPLDRRGLHRRLRAGAATRRVRHRPRDARGLADRDAQRAASSRSPTPRSAATGACARRSRRSGAARSASRGRRSRWSWPESRDAPQPFTAFVIASCSDGDGEP